MATSNLHKVMCDRCSQLERQVAERDSALAGMTVDLENLQADLLGKNRQIKKLTRQLAADQDTRGPDERQLAIFGYWIERLGKDRKKVKLGPGREKAINARLNEGWSVDELKKAIDGCALLPYVGPHGRSATGNPKQRHDDLELICRNEINVERFMGYADAHREHSQRNRERLLDTAKTQARTHYGQDTLTQRTRWSAGTLENLLHALEQKGCNVSQRGQDSARQMAQCPAHEDRSPSLSIREEDDGRVLLHCFAGCETSAILEALGLEWTDLFGDVQGGALLTNGRGEGW